MPEPSPQFELFSAAVRPQVLTVTEVTRSIKEALEGRFERVSIQGEISNLSRPGSGHIYFTLKDSGATLGAAFFRQQAKLMKFDLQTGQQVIARGRISVYEP